MKQLKDYDHEAVKTLDLLAETHRRKIKLLSLK